MTFNAFYYHLFCHLPGFKSVRFVRMVLMKIPHFFSCAYMPVVWVVRIALKLCRQLLIAPEYEFLLSDKTT